MVLQTYYPGQEDSTPSNSASTVNIVTDFVNISNYYLQVGGTLKVSQSGLE